MSVLDCIGAGRGSAARPAVRPSGGGGQSPQAGNPGAATARQLRPGRLRIGRGALHTAPRRSPERDIRLRQPLQALVARRRLSRAPWWATRATWCDHRTRGHRHCVPACEPAHEDRGCTPPARLGCSQSPAPTAGADAIVDLVSIGPLRVRGRVRCCSRGPAAGVPAAIAGRRINRGVLARVHGRALPKRRSRRSRCWRPGRTVGVAHGASPRCARRGSAGRRSSQLIRGAVGAAPAALSLSLQASKASMS